MARFLFWSDLHCEFSPFQIPVPACQPGATPNAPAREEIDAILLPGDIDVKGRHVDWLIGIWDVWRRPVLAVAGNHEPYGARRYQKHEAQERDRIAHAQGLGVDIEVMRQAERIIGDTRVIGATLWTDMRLYPDRVDLAQLAIKDGMNDYRRIRWHDSRTGIYRRMIPADTIAMHLTDRDYIFDRLARGYSGRTVVMTHHLPVIQMVNERRLSRRETLDAAYASDLWPMIGNHALDAWICGHSHDSREAVLEGAEGEVAFLRNCRGYPGERTEFDPLRVLDSNNVAPHLGIGSGSEPRVV